MLAQLVAWPTPGIYLRPFASKEIAALNKLKAYKSEYRNTCHRLLSHSRCADIICTCWNSLFSFAASERHLTSWEVIVLKEYLLLSSSGKIIWGKRKWRFLGESQLASSSFCLHKNQFQSQRLRHQFVYSISIFLIVGQ